MKPIRLKILFFAFAALLLLSCDKQEKVEEQKKPEPLKATPVSMLSLIPADTVFFVGGLARVPLKESLQWTVEHFNFSTEMFNPQAMEQFSEKAKTAGQKMATQLWKEYVATVIAKDMQQFASLGIEDAPMLALYAIGLSPVFRISLKDVQQFNAKIAALEEKAKIKIQPETFGTAVYRRYALTEQKDGQQEPQVSLIIGVDGKDAVFLLDMGVDSQQVLSLALGQSKPEKSLEQTGRLKSLQDTYKLVPAWLGYIDHQQIIDGLTTKDGNRMAKMVQLLALKMKEDGQKKLAELQSEGCRNDLQAIGKNWPQTVGGYTVLDLKNKPSRIHYLVAVESTDQPLLDDLHSMRGFVPDYTNPSFVSAVSSFAIGLNVENIAPFLMKQWTEITKKQYSCSILQEMQVAVKEKNPAAVGIAASMAAGVRGIAFSLLSLKLEKPESGQNMPMPKEIEAVISLSAKEPAALVQMASAMFPQVAALKIPADGTPVELPVPAPTPLPFIPKVAVNGQHLTVYVGEKAGQLAKELGKMPLESSQGIMAGAFDYSKYYGMMADLMTDFGKNDPKAAEAAAVLEAMKGAKVRAAMSMDFTKRGIEFKADMISVE